MISHFHRRSGGLERKGGFRRNWRMPAAILGALVALSAGAFAAEPAASKEYKIKAAFLYNFTKFVEWPEERFATADAPIVIGVLGPNPFSAELEATVQGRKVNARSVRIVRLESADKAAGVHLLFISAAADEAYASAVRAEKEGVLTVGETDRFAELGGVITFKTVGDKVRFEVNVAAAEARGLKLSAQLQKLATAVRR